LCRGAIVDGGHHLGGDEAVPDQLVELVLLVLQVLLDRVGVDLGARRPDRLVGVLRVLLGLVDVRLRRDELLAVALADLFPDLVQRVIAHPGRVGAHVRDKPHRAAVALEIDALVEGLRDLHGALGAEVEVARRVLLELRGGVGRRRVAPLLAPRDLVDPVARALEISAHLRRGLAVLNLELPAIAAGGEPRDERGVLRAGEADAHVPVLLGDERLDLALAIDDEAERHRLHPPGRQAEGELRPDQRRDVVAHDPVEHAPGALGVVEVLVELARVAHALIDAALGDLVELDPLHLEPGALDLLGDVERDRLAFPIGVGGEQHLIDLLRGGFELLEDLLLALDDRVRLREVVADVHGLRPLGQILEVALGGEHVEPRPEVLLDRLRLGRRLHDDECLGHHHLLTFSARLRASGTACLKTGSVGDGNRKRLDGGD
jgi:hypothetical protein